MKLYDCATAPSPRRVRIFIAEKGLDIPVHEINLREGEQFADWYKEKNPCCTVPTLELNDGTCIPETMAICRYLEAVHPQPALFGETLLDQAQVTFWNRRVESEGLMGIAEALRNQSRGFKDRAMTGSLSLEQIPELAQRGRTRAAHFMGVLEQRLASSEYVGGKTYSVADITALVFVDFAKWVKLEPDESMQNLKRWHAGATARPGSVT